MGLEADRQKDVYIGYGNDLPVLRKKVISYYAVEKKSRSFKFSNTTGYAFRGFI